MTDTTQAAGLTDEQINAMLDEIDEIARDVDMYEFGLPIADDARAQMREVILAALAAQAVPAIDVEKHMCGYARLGSDGVYKLVGMRRNPIMDDGELHLILAFTDDQIESFAPPRPCRSEGRAEAERSNQG